LTTLVLPDSASYIMPSLISSDATLAAACERWSVAGVIGVDTEFVRERTFHPRPGLIQVADGGGVEMIDPLGINDFGPFERLLVDPSVVKLMHACGEDLEVFELLVGATPLGIFDTQLAGAFAGYGFSLGYSGLVEVLLDVLVEKGETRSDWLRRPLSPAQLHYAALDVLYLTPVYVRLSQELAVLGRATWLAEELGHRQRMRAIDRQLDAAYLRVRRREALPPAHHAVLRALSEWREIEAMTRDIPRRHLLTDEALIALASIPILDAASLSGVPGVSPRFWAHYGSTLLDQIATARAQGPADTDTPCNLRPYASTMKRLKEIVWQEADARKLPPELLANRRGLEALLIGVLQDGGDVPEEFRGWRFDVVTKALLECIHAAKPNVRWAG
jgi:ribonuclease D